jgi:hypothetical protein
MSAKKVLLAQYDLHNVLYNNVIDQVSDEESNHSIKYPMNNVKWIAGHLLQCQGHLSRIGGTNVSIPWGDHFPAGPGAPQVVEGGKSEFPTLSQIKDKWNELHPIIRQGLENLPEEALATTIDAKHPIFPFDNSLAGLWAFINHHQALHIGQISVLRRGLNKDAMKFS